MKTLLLFLLMLAISANAPAQTCGGLDISIANDQSGSVDATENAQSRTFIRNLSASLTLGNANDQSRIQLSNWAHANTFSQYSFPSVGLNYTTLQSDVISYVNKPRTISGGTDPYQALQKAYGIRNQTPIAGRTVPKIIILMTDASCYQVQSAIKTLATQIKASGTYIMVLAIQDAATCTILQGTNVASPGMYFSAASYASLAANAQTTITNMLNAACPAVPPTPVFDLSVTITSFNCGTGTVGYNVTNNGAAAFSGTLQTVFYNGDPRLITTRLLYTDTRAGQTIAAGATGTFSFTQASLIGVKNIYAVVNLNTTGTNGTPPIPIDIAPRLLVSGEGNTVNNFSNVLAGTGCAAAPRLEVSKTASIGCNKQANYTVQVCNTGSAAAANVAVTEYGPTGFTFVSGSSTGGSTPTPVNKLGTRQWASYLGGSADDAINSMAIDASGNIYLAGSTKSTGFPVTTGGSFSGTEDGFLTKMSADGATVLWSMFIGNQSGNTTIVNNVVTDASGNVYVCGFTDATAGIASGVVFQNTFQGSLDGFVMKFNSSGVKQWGTYVGTTSSDRIFSVAIDASGNVYAAGYAASGIGSSGTFQQTTGAGQLSAFLIKLNGATGFRLWGTYLNGNISVAISYGYSVQVNGSSVYVGGYTTSGGATGSPGSFQPNFGTGITNGFIISLNISNGIRNWGTYCQQVPQINNIQVDASGNVYAINNAGVNPIVKFNSTGTALLWSTAVQDNINTSSARGLKLDGNYLIAAYRTSITGIGTSGVYQSSFGGGTSDFFIQYLDISTGTQQYAGYYGGTATDAAATVALDPGGNIVVAGVTGSSGLASAGTFDNSFNGGTYDGLIVKFGPGITNPSLPAGQCITLNYVYDASAVAAGTYNNSIGVTTTTTPVTYSPNTNFTVNSVSGLNGFNGAVNTTDDITVPAVNPCTAALSPVTAAVSMSSASSCGGAGNYTMATITLTNPNTGITINNLLLNLGVTGTGALFASEPNSFTNGLLVAEPDVLDPAYPAVPYAIYGTSGTQTLPLFTLPPGTSTFQVDIDMGSATANVTAQVTGIPTIYNASGSTVIATDATGVTISATPTAAINTCPGTVTIAATTVNFSSNSTTNAASVEWKSNTGGSFLAGGSLSSPTALYTITDQDRANGYVDVSLRAINGGCDAEASCRVLITGATYDFGDLPASYDLLQTGQPYVAGAFISSGTLKLGAVAPDGEALPKANASATGDNFDNTDDEDGVVLFPAISLGMTNYSVTVTASNTNGTAATLIGWIDWNNNNQFEPSEAATPVTVPNGTNNGSFVLNWSSITPAQGMWGHARFRIADALTIYDYVGTTATGEVEDYTILNFVLPLTLTNFTAVKQNSDALLSWTTSSEQNSAYFIIEHSTDGIHFNAAGMVQAAGNSSTLIHYRFIHKGPATGANYYRLKMMDINGAFVYSEMRLLNVGNAGSVIIVYPNPVKDQLTLTGIEAGMQLRIINTMGQRLTNVFSSGNTMKLNISQLPSALYVLQVIQDNNIIKSIKIVKP